MAVVVRSRRLVNPSKRRYSRRGLASLYRKTAKKLATKAKKRKNPMAKRKMSPKQIAIFGTARQKAALRAARSRKRNAGMFSFRKTKKRAKAAYKRGDQATGYNISSYLKRIKTNRKKPMRKKNVGEIVSISLAGLGNPGKKRRVTRMAKRRKAARRRRNYGTAVGRSWSHLSKRRRKNPGVRRRRRHASAGHSVRRRRRNPTYRVRRIRRRNPGLGSMTSGVLGKVIGIIGGAVGTRFVTQTVLGGNNTGVVGYAGNAVSAIGLGWAVGKFAGKEFGNNVMIGGFVGLALRVIQDRTSLGQYVNLSLQGAGKGGDIGIGMITDSSFFTPQVPVQGSMTSFITPRQTRGYVAGQISAAGAQRAQMASKGGVGMVYGRRNRGIM